MMVERPSWSQRLRTRVRQEAAFLPKRLVLIALLLFALYLVLLIRTEYGALYAHVGFVEARLKSKLQADYDVVERPVIPFAPLRLELIEAKIQDDNPALSAGEVTTLVQIAVAAAAAPIVPATPTPPPHVPVVINAAVVIEPNLLLTAQPLTDDAARLAYQSTPGAFVPSPKLLIGTAPNVVLPIINNFLDGINAGAHPTQPTTVTLSPAQVLSQQSTATVAALHTNPSQGQPQGPAATSMMVSPLMVVDTLFVSPLPTMNLLSVTKAPTDVNAPATHLAASQPSLSHTPTALALVISVTSQPSATWTPWPTATPWPTSTASPTPLLPLPTMTGNPLALGEQLSVTVTPLILLPATATATTTAMPTTTPTAVTTPIPTPTATAPPPTATALLAPVLTPTPTATPTAPAVTPPTLTPTITVLPLIDRLMAYVQGDKVYLEWPPATGAGIVGYNLYRQNVANSSVERMNEEPLLNAAYVDTVTLDGNQYAYRVTTVDQRAQESLPSQAVTVTVADRKPPQAPGNVLTRVDGARIEFRWDANMESDFVGYNMYRDTQAPVTRTQGPLNGATLVTTPIYVDTLPLNGQTYYYVVTAIDGAGNESAPSREVQVATHNAAAPAPPRGLTATFEDDDDDDDDEDNEDEINLKWQANQEAAVVGYRLYRATALPVDTTTAPLHKKPLLTTLHYKDEDLARDVTYYYVIVAVDQEQNVSLPSEAVAVTVPK